MPQDDTPQGIPKISDSVSSLTRGITDNYLVHDERGFCQTAKNFIFDSSRRPRPHRGSTLINKKGTQIPSKLSGVRIDGLFSLGNHALIALSAGRVYVYDESSDTFTEATLQGVVPTADGGLTVFTGTSFTFASYLNEFYIASGRRDNNGLPDPEPVVKFYIPRPGAVDALYLNIPKVNVSLDTSQDPTTLGGTEGIYLYYFVFTRTYKSSGYTKTDYGPLTPLAVTKYSNRNTHRFAVQGADLSPLYGVLHVRVYRTLLDQTTAYQIGQPVLFNKISGNQIVDTKLGSTATSIQSGSLLPPSVSDVSNIVPPNALFVSSGGGRLFLGSVKVGETVLSNRVYYSAPGSFGIFPVSNFIDFDNDITGVSAFRNNVVVTTYFTVSRLEGVGSGALSAYEFENTSGCISSRSLVATSFGIFYVSRDGVYLTNGLKAQKISDHISERYARIRDKESVIGFYDPDNYRLYFYYTRYISSDSYHTEALVLDLLLTQPTRDGGVFTEFSVFSGYDSAELRLGSRAFANHRGDVYRGNRDGTVSKLVSGLLTNEVFDTREGIVTSSDPQEGRVRRLPVFFEFLSGGLYFGNVNDIKYIQRISFSLRARRSGELQFFGIADAQRRSEFSVQPIVGTDLDDSRELPLQGGSQVSFEGVDAVVIRSRPVDSGTKSSFYQVGLKNGLKTEHIVRFSFMITTGGSLSARVPVRYWMDDPQKTMPFKNYSKDGNLVPYTFPWVGYLWRFGTDEETLSGFGDIPRTREWVVDTDTSNMYVLANALTIGNVIYLSGFTKSHLVNGLGLTAGREYTGKATLDRRTSLDFEVLGLDVEGSLVGSPRKVRTVQG